jgi:hypothetical protein
MEGMKFSLNMEPSSIYRKCIFTPTDSKSFNNARVACAGILWRYWCTSCHIAATGWLPGKDG